MDTATKTRLDALKTATKKVGRKGAEATAEFIENTYANKIVKPKPGLESNSTNLEKNNYSFGKKERNYLIN